MMARRLAQEIGKFLIGGHDPNGVGRDQKEIVRIIGWFRVQRGLHWRSILSPMSPA
jgi:hypothetical protein